MTRRNLGAEGSGPAIVTDHKFQPKGEWWSLCAICNLAQSAHLETEKPTQKAMTEHFQKTARTPR